VAGNIGVRGGERGVSAWRQGCGGPGPGDVRGNGTERWQMNETEKASERSRMSYWRLG